MSTLMFNFNRLAVGDDLAADSSSDLTSKSATLYSTLAEELDAVDPSASHSGDLVAAAQALLGVDPVDFEDEAEFLANMLQEDLARDEKHQIAMRQLGAVAGGDEKTLAGRMPTGAAAVAIEKTEGLRQADKRKKFDLELLMLIRIQQMERHLIERVELMNELSQKLREKASEGFEKSAECFALEEEIKRHEDVVRQELAENGRLSVRTRRQSGENINTSRRLCRKGQLSAEQLNEMDDRELAAKEVEARKDVAEAGVEYYENAKECLEVSESLAARAEPLMKELERIKDLPIAEQEEAYRKIFDNTEDRNLLMKAAELTNDQELQERVARYLDAESSFKNEGTAAKPQNNANADMAHTFG